jgi:uncharacterized protein YkwD
MSVNEHNFTIFIAVKSFRHILLSFLILFSTLSFSQKGTDVIDLGQFNSVLLDSLIFEAVIKRRRQNDLPKLFWSDAMADSAKNHAAAMQTKNKLFYNDLRKGQCVVELEFEDGRVTYSVMAARIVDRWINSPGHKKLILGPLFIYGAVSIIIQEQDDHLILRGVFYVSYEP